MTNTRPVSNLQSPIVEVKQEAGKLRGYLLAPWMQFFQQFVQNAAAVVNVTAGASPFEYTPNQNGTVIVSGGTVSLIELIRGPTTISIANNTSVARIIPVSISDTVRVTYSVLPTIQFLGA